MTKKKYKLPKAYMCMYSIFFSREKREPVNHVAVDHESQAFE